MDDLWGKLPIFGNTHMLNFGRVVTLFILAHPWSASFNVSGWVERCFAFGLYRSNWIQRRQLDWHMWSKHVKIHSRTSQLVRNMAFCEQKPCNFKFEQKESEISSFILRSLLIFVLNACPSIAFCCHFLQRCFLLQGENDRKKQLFVPYFESWPMTIWRRLMNAINALVVFWSGNVHSVSENCDISSHVSNKEHTTWTCISNIN